MNRSEVDIMVVFNKKRLVLQVVFTALIIFSVFQSSAAKPVTVDKKTDLIQLIKQESETYKINADLIAAIVRVESNFNRLAVSHSGAQGLMQLMPPTQKDLGVKEPFDARQNIKGGIRYFILQLQRFGSVRKALWAYNAGPERVKQQTIPEETRQYANRILQIFWQSYAKNQM